MSTRWRRLVAALAHREPPTPLALFRLAVGLILCWVLVDPVLSGALRPVWFPAADGGLASGGQGVWLWSLLGGTGAAQVWGVLLVGLGAALALAAGLAGRVAALVLLQCFLALLALNPGTGGGHDRLLTNALWLLVLAPADATLSLSCRLRTGRWLDPTPRVAWPRYVAVYQLALVYACTGIQKVGADWWPWGGLDAVHYALLTPSWQRFSWLGWVGWLAPLTHTGTLVTVLWEIGWPLVPLALYFRATRTRPGRLRAWSNRLDLRALFALIGVTMHVLVWAAINVGPFSPATLSFYLCLWHHDEYRRLARRLLPGRYPSIRNTLPEAKSAT